MKIFHMIHNYLIQHKYAINAQQLGDHSECAWSNLGYWADTDHYVDACRHLADHLAQSVKLQACDRLLDLGCGHGASLIYWQQHYQIADLEAVELQQQAVQKIAKHFTTFKESASDTAAAFVAIHAQSFLDLQPTAFTHRFDVVLCLDAAYHSHLDLFLDSVTRVMHAKGRLGFHYLMLSEKWQHLGWLEKQKYRYLLQLADVNLNHLALRTQYIQNLTDHDFEQIQILDISAQVLQGFAKYAATLSNHSRKHRLDFFKIKMTAKLCERLYRDGLIQYVQISAVYQ